MDIDAGPILVRLQGEAHDSVKPRFAQIANLHERRLWHELSVVLGKLFASPQGKSSILPLYRELIVPLQKKISPDAFVRFSIQAAAQLGDVREAVSLLSGVAEQYKAGSPDASHHLFVHARATAGLYQLGGGLVKEAKEAIDECQPLVEAFAGVDPSIKAAFFRLKSEYDKAKALFSAYYRDAFLFLACVALEELSVEEKTVLAHDLCLAALLGETVYNFGELLIHPIIESIRNHPELGVLVQTLTAFNAGDHGKFEQLLPVVKSQPILAPRIEFLRQKMCLMALVDCVFSQLKSSRQVPFATISAATRVPLQEIEFLLIKAISLGLLRGSIDELAQVLQVQWVQPRVLDMQQLAGLRAAIREWKGRIAVASQSIDAMSSLAQTMSD